MKNLIALFFSVYASSALAAPPSPPKDLKPLAIGQPAPAFDLLGIDGERHTLERYADKAVLAVLFTCNHCPTAQAVEERVKQLVRDYQAQSFQLIAISPNDPEAVRIDELGYSVHGDSYEEMKAHAAEQGFNFPYLFDGDTQQTALTYGALATPHLFLFGADRKLRYQGRIDDSKYEDGATRHDGRNAIDALLAGQPVPVETTRAFGCSTKWASKRNKVGEAEEAWKQREVTVEPIDAAGIAALAANPTSKLRLINLWATWCGPCVEEFPDLVQLGRQFESRGFDFISISVDDASQLRTVHDFLRSEHAAMGKRTAFSVQEEGRTTNNYLYNSTDLDALGEALDAQWDGGVPYSVLIAPRGEIIFRHSGEIDVMEARRQIIGYLGRFYSPAG